MQFVPFSIGLYNLGHTQMPFSHSTMISGLSIWHSFLKRHDSPIPEINPKTGYFQLVSKAIKYIVSNLDTYWMGKHVDLSRDDEYLQPSLFQVKLLTLALKKINLYFINRGLKYMKQTKHFKCNEKMAINTHTRNNVDLLGVVDLEAVFVLLPSGICCIATFLCWKGRSWIRRVSHRDRSWRSKSSKRFNIAWSCRKQNFLWVFKYITDCVYLFMLLFFSLLYSNPLTMEWSNELRIEIVRGRTKSTSAFCVDPFSSSSWYNPHWTIWLCRR